MLKANWVVWSLAVGLTWTSFGSAEVIIDDSIELSQTESGGPSLLRAFRVNGRCQDWQYIPSAYFVSGPFEHLTYMSSSKFGAEHLSTQITELRMSASPELTDDLLDRLKEKIATQLEHIPACKGAKYTARDIGLNSTLVYSVPIKPKSSASEPGKEELSDEIFDGNRMPKFDYITSRNTKTDARVLFDPSAVFHVSKFIDATDPESGKILQTFVQQKEGLQSLGSVQFAVDGIIASVDSRIHLKKELEADFVLKVVNEQCTVKNQDKALGHTAMAEGIAARLTGYKGLTGQSRFTSKTTTCTFRAVSVFAGGSDNSTFETEHKGRLNWENNKEIMITPCDEKGECGQPVTLESYLDFRLMTQLILTNFEYEIKQLADNTFVEKLGKSGPIKTVMNFNSSYKRLFHDRVVVSIPVYARNLDPNSLDLKFLESPLNKCFREKYVMQQNRFAKWAGLLPVPVDTSCISNPANGGR